MSVRLMSQVWDEAPFTGSDLLVLLALADAASDEGYCWPSVPTIAKKARLQDRRVQTALSTLCESGWLERHERKSEKGNQSNMYRVIIPPGGCSCEHQGGVCTCTRGVSERAPRTVKRTVSEPSPGSPVANAPSEPPPAGASAEEPTLFDVTEPEQPSRAAQDAETGFEDWYRRYPRKVARGQAVKAYKAALKKVSHDELVSATVAFSEQVQGTAARLIPHPATWLNGERWLDVEREAEKAQPPHYFTRFFQNYSRIRDDGRDEALSFWLSNVDPEDGPRIDKASDIYQRKVARGEVERRYVPSPAAWLKREEWREIIRPKAWWEN